MSESKSIETGVIFKIKTGVIFKIKTGVIFKIFTGVIFFKKMDSRAENQFS